MNDFKTLGKQARSLGEQDLKKATSAELQQAQNEIWTLDVELNSMLRQLTLEQRRAFQEVAMKYKKGLSK